MSLIYPICYKTEDSYIPGICGPGKNQTYVKRSWGDPREYITGWQLPEGYPISGTGIVPEYLPGPPASAANLATIEDVGDPENSFFVKIGRGIQEAFKLGNKSLDTAKLLGWVAIAGIGGGLLLYYVPRKKR